MGGQGGGGYWSAKRIEYSLSRRHPFVQQQQQQPAPSIPRRAAAGTATLLPVVPTASGLVLYCCHLTVLYFTVLYCTVLQGTGRPGLPMYRSWRSFLRDARHNHLLLIPAGLYAVSWG